MNKGEHVCMEFEFFHDHCVMTNRQSIEECGSTSRLEGMSSMEETLKRFLLSISISAVRSFGPYGAGEMAEHCGLGSWKRRGHITEYRKVEQCSGC